MNSTVECPALEATSSALSSRTHSVLPVDSVLPLNSARPAVSGSDAAALYGRATAGFEQRVARALDALRAAAEQHAGRIVQSTSLGAEGMVVTDLIARHGLAIPVATLDTGALHSETLAMIGRIESHYGLTVEVHRPRAEQVVHFVSHHGDRPMYRSLELRRACCAVRKLEPMARLLEGRDAWVTGMRRDQSEARSAVLMESRDHDGRSKINPLADWSWADVWHYIALHQVPYNALHDRFFPSIGCEPCTRAIAVGEDFRAGRWWWEDGALKECGLHVGSLPAPTHAAAGAVLE